MINVWRTLPVWVRIVGPTLGIIAIAGSIVLAWNHFISGVKHESATTAVQAEVVKTQIQTIQNVETANAAAEIINQQVRSGTGPELYAQCLRSARHPEKCQRFLPAGQADQR